MNVVGFEDRPRHFLHQVVLFAGASARADESERIATVTLANSRQTFSYSIQRLVPGCRAQLSVRIPDQGLGKSVFVMNKIVGETAFDAEIAVVDRSTRRWAGDLDDPVGLAIYVDIDLTTDSTEVAGGSHLLQISLRFAIDQRLLLGHGPRGTNIHTAATELTGRIRQRLQIGRGNRRLSTPMSQTDGAHRLHLVAVARAQ